MLLELFATAQTTSNRAIHKDKITESEGTTTVEALGGRRSPKGDWPSGRTRMFAERVSETLMYWGSSIFTESQNMLAYLFPIIVGVLTSCIQATWEDFPYFV